MKENIGKYISLLRKMVSVPSHSFEEDKVADLVCAFLEKEGIICKRERNNILALTRHFDPVKRTLALDAHIDTVPPSEAYTRNPYDAGNDDDVVWGLGSNDDGGSVVSMIAAFAYFYEEILPINIMLVITCEEERSGANGSTWLYGSTSPLGRVTCTDANHSRTYEFPRPEWVIIGEPTGMKVATSERGLLVLDGEACGVSGHAAREEGVNALYIAVEDIARIRGHRFLKHSELMGDVKLNVTQINAGTVHNIIPDSCRFTVDIRPTEKYTNEEIWKELQAICRSTLTPRRLTNRSSATYGGSPLLRTVAELGMDTFSSPTTSDWMQTGCDAVKMGPGESSRSHRADEFILVSEIEDAIDKYIAFIRVFGEITAG
ncbi:MAG: M20/M25/M40 family metallo-hydrolase [Alistipes sp.]|nr:M20/M25/M40 family metallo-hydrolase [Candidatus Minthomonas equi]